MKRLLLTTVVLLAVAAQAQVTTNPNAKVDPKNNKVSRPVVDKPKEVLMTRAELRKCLDEQEYISGESKAIHDEYAVYKVDHDALVAERAALEKQGDKVSADFKAGSAEHDSLTKAYADLNAAAPKLEKADLEAQKKVLEDRRAAFEANVPKINEEVTTYKKAQVDYDAKIEPLQARPAALEKRQDAMLDKQDDWKASCTKKKYDELDEVAVKKERAADQAAAAKAAAAASATAPAASAAH